MSLSSIRSQVDLSTKLSRLFSILGPDLLRDRRRFLSLMEDVHPGEEARGDRYLLQAASDPGIVGALLAGRPSLAEQKRLETCLTRLFIAEEAAARIIGLLIGAIEKAKKPQPCLHEPFTLSELGMGMAWIPSGSFVMGSPDEEQGRHKDEGPQTIVSISHGFWLGEAPVTVGQFGRFVEQSGYCTEAEKPSYGKIRVFEGPLKRKETCLHWRTVSSEDPQCPVVGITWNDAVAFCRWLTNREAAQGRLLERTAFMLPSEQEWEYACRAGCQGRWCFGNEEENLEDYAWYWNNSRGYSHPVKMKQPNSWSLFDMHGNVWEWTSSPYAPYRGGEASEFPNQMKGIKQVYRGGSWWFKADYQRSAMRMRLAPDHCNNGLGFRIALRTVPQLPSSSASGQVSSSGHVPQVRESAPSVGVPSPVQPESLSSALSPGSSATLFLKGGNRLELVWIAPGVCCLGSPESEVGHTAAESPRTLVRIPGFWASRFLVTQALWTAVMDSNPLEFNGIDPASRPIEKASFSDAQEFCRKLTWTMGRRIRLPSGFSFQLPSEAQWEFFARAGRQTPWAGCDEPEKVGEFAWYSENSRQQAHPIGLKKPNPWGLYDTHGNVWEWTSTRFAPYPGGKKTLREFESNAKRANLSSAYPETRVLRGGSWGVAATETRCAQRGRLAPGLAGHGIGLRIVLAERWD